MNKLFPLLLAFFVAGCTTPSQKIASVSLERGMDQIADIKDDLSTLAKQQTLDLGVAKVRSAAAAGDKDLAESVLTESFNTLNRIGWLEIEFEKAKSYFRIGQIYIASQKGAMDLLYEDVKQVQEDAK